MSKITGKYQITLPQKVREALNAHIGDNLVFNVQESGEVSLKVMRRPTVAELYGALHRPQLAYVPYEEARRLAQDEKSARDRIT